MGKVKVFDIEMLELQIDSELDKLNEAIKSNNEVEKKIIKQRLTELSKELDKIK